MIVDHILCFPLGPTTALPNSNSGIPSQKTSNSSPNPCSLTCAAAWDPPPSSQFEGVICHYYQLQTYTLCQAQMQFQLQKVCFAAAAALRLAVALHQGKQLLQGAVVSVLNIPITSSVLKMSASSKVKSNSWHLLWNNAVCVFFSQIIDPNYSLKQYFCCCFVLNPLWRRLNSIFLDYQYSVQLEPEYKRKKIKKVKCKRSFGHYGVRSCSLISI